MSEREMAVRLLRARLQDSTDEEEKTRIKDTLAEMETQSLSGSGHHREGSDKPS